MTGEERPRILDPEAALEHRLDQIADLAEGPDPDAEDQHVNTVELRQQG